MSKDKTVNVPIVDDYKIMLRIIRSPLKQIDLDNVDEAVDGGEAVGNSRADNRGLVISMAGPFDAETLKGRTEKVLCHA